ncbi:MAG: T9SS type A sorting domain-containing protein [Bacteroidales bacterium]|jgi:hypothetical protein|nr:T9SS type A sorting domain-containing protein [Bacteroidales bacterium]
MKRGLSFIGVIVIAISAGSFFWFNSESKDKGTPEMPRVRSVFSPKAPIEEKNGRDEYFLNMLMDPSTGKVPDNIRQKELAFARVNDVRFSERGESRATAFSWEEAGPIDVGGRTRAIGIDKRNSNIIIAGGVSGGVWKSTDKGANWTLVNNPDEYNGITSIAQDTRAGHEDTWYYTTGEHAGNSATARSFSSSYSGNGIYVSNDNGSTWNAIEGTTSGMGDWNSMFDYVSEIEVSPTTGSVIIAINGYGIARKPAGTNKFTLTLGNINGHAWSNIEIDSKGTMYAVLSTVKVGYGSTQTNQPGIYKSTNDGETWTRLSISNSLASKYDRGILEIAPSNEDIAYLYLVYEKSQSVKTPYFYKINLKDVSIIDRSNNVRETYVGGSKFNPVQEKIGNQGDYNMTLAVHPTDENFVVIGSTSLFRSKDAYATKPDANYTWIGGYGNKAVDAFEYPNHHPDCHISVFDPNNPNAMWSGHDGGLSYTSNIKTNSTSSSYLKWEDKNRGYNITQFYNVSIEKNADGNAIMGGAQDNGSPFFQFDGTTATESADLSSGDGAYCAIGDNYTYASSQYGKVIRRNNRIPSEWTRCHPAGATGQLFIHPFVIDPNDNNVMYYPSGNRVWRNSDLSKISNFNQYGVNTNWSSFSVAAVGYTITSIAVSEKEANVLYVGAYDRYKYPKLYKVVDADKSTRKITEIIIPDMQNGAFPHDIFINPKNNNEVIFVMSNYGIKGIYHTNDGGTTLTCVEGNLLGTNANPGPSIRAAAIIDGDSKVYLIGTSTGLYSTEVLNGNSTVWTKVAPSLIGSVIVNDIDVSVESGKIIAGTHGRGIFVGKLNSYIWENNKITDISLNVNEATTKNIDISNLFKSKGTKPTVTIKSNSNETLIKTNITGDNLKIDIKPDLTGEAIIVFEGVSDGNKATSELKVTIDYDLKLNKQISDFNLNPKSDKVINLNLKDIFSYTDKPDFTINSSKSDFVTAVINDPNVVLTIKDNTLDESTIIITASKYGKTVKSEFKVIVDYNLKLLKTISDYNILLNSKENIDLDLTTIFSYDEKPDFTVTSNNESLVTANLIDTDLTLTIKKDIEGESTITVTASKYGKTVKSVFKIKVSKVLGINNELSTKVKIYPNPTTGGCNINLPDGNFKLRVFNMSGKLVMVKNNITNNTAVNITDKANGTYLFEISKDNVKTIKKVIKR